MEASLLEKANNSDQMQKYLSLRKKYSVNSVISMPEFHDNSYLGKIIIIISILSLILGLYILFNSSFYFNPNYKFKHNSLFYYYILIYTFGLLGLLLLSFCVTLIIKLIISCKKVFKSNDEVNNELLDEREIILEDDNNILFNELENADNITIIPYTLTICIFLSIILYLIGFPFSFYLIYILRQNIFYRKLKEFILIYLFIIFNDISGAIFIFVLITLFRTKSQNSFRKMKYSFDEENLMTAYKEVKDAINLAK